jgi:hypothetical protein
MDEKRRLSGFKALLESHKTSGSLMEETDGNLRLWRYLSPEAKLEYIVRDAAIYDVPFEQFSQAARETVGTGAVEEAALRLALRSGRELHDLEKMFPEDGGTESPPPLSERLREMLNAASVEHGDEEVLSCDKMAALFIEMRADEAAAKREDAHWYGREASQDMPEENTKSPGNVKDKDWDIER